MLTEHVIILPELQKSALVGRVGVQREWWTFTQGLVPLTPQAFTFTCCLFLCLPVGKIPFHSLWGLSIKKQRVKVTIFYTYA